MTGERYEATYRLICRELRADIARGRYAGGRRLPTEAELSERYGASRQTIRRAFHDLVAEGLVYRVQGRGTFVRTTRPGYLRQFGSVDDLMSLSEDTRMRVVDPLSRVVDLPAASRLRLDHDRVFRIRFTRSHGDEVFCATTVHLPPELGHALLDLPELSTPGAPSSLTVIGSLERELGVAIAEAQQSVTVEGADADAATALGCPPGHPLLRIDRLYLDASGRAVELAVSHFLPERYSYRVNLRRSS